MANEELVARVTRFLERHIAECERLLETPDAADPAEDTGTAVRDAARQGASFSQAEQELQILLREWNGTDGIDPGQQDRVRQLAARAQEVSLALAERRARDAREAAARIEEVRSELGDLHRGKSALGGYRAGDRGDAGYLDRDA